MAIVGGGIVGLATAYACLQRMPGCRVAVLEKEPRVGAHQTGHNSGVIHSGIYYRPGSLKAAACVAGAALLRRFCDERGVPYRITGKLIVATSSDELPRLTQLYARGQANGIEGLALVGPERIRELEPHARGVQALHVPGAGVVEYPAVAEALARAIREFGGEVVTSARVLRGRRRDRAWRLDTTAGEVRSAWLVTCGGLHADRVAAAAGARPGIAIVPFRGDYYALVPARRSLVNTMIYPVPDPVFPFLGVHFTRGLSGEVHVGPSAVLALKREGYGRTDVSIADTLAMARQPGFWRMARAYWRTGAREFLHAFSRAAFVRAAQHLVPELDAADLAPHPSGVRAQAVDVQGRLLDDFVLLQDDHALHALNVPSPAATASLRIGQLIADRVALLTV